MTRSLKSSVFRAFSWTMVGQFASLGIRFVGSIILTRIFTPEVFGVLAVVTVVQIVTHLLTDVGIVQAVIQSKSGEDKAFLNTAWTVQVIRGLLIWALGLLVALLLWLSSGAGWVPSHSVYAYPALPSILTVACFSSVIMGFQTTKNMVAQRNLDVNRVVIIDLATQLITLGVTIVAGILTRSIWSYVFAGLFSSCLCVILSHIWLRGHRDRFAWEKSSLEELTKFGRWIFVSSALGGAGANSDRLFLGALTTPANLGYYSLANNLLSIVESISTRIFSSIVLPALSSVFRSQPERFSELYFRVRWLTDLSMIGLAGFFFATGQFLVELLYDHRYWEAGWMLQWLSFGLLFSRYGLAQNAYIALGEPKFGSFLHIIKLLSLLILLPLLYHLFGLPGAIAAIAVHMLPFAIATLFFNAGRGLNNFRLEFAVLGAWPLGWAVGLGLVKAAAMAKSFLPALHSGV